MKSLVFDAGPVISLTMNNLLWVLEPMKKSFGGEFLISEPVKFELVEKPLTIKRYEFEALQIQGQIDCRILKVVSGDRINKLSSDLLSLANNCFWAKGTNINIVHSGEMSSLASAIIFDSEATVIDERTTRDLIENPGRIAKNMQARLHTKISINEDSLAELRKQIGKVKVLRSVELVSVAFEMGLIDRYVDRCKNPSSELRKRLLDSVLWGMKLDGCAVSESEIRQITKIVLGN